MKQKLALLILAIVMPAAAQADCFVEYKAKMDDPLRLHYGIIALDSPCPSSKAAAKQASRRIDSGGWSLLNIVGMSETPPAGAKKANAGDYFLRF